MARIAITGSTGLLGGALAASLRADGHDILPVTRSGSADAADVVVWDPMEGSIEAHKLEGVDAVVHLAGAPIGKRWTAEHRRRIHESRERGTRVLAEALAGLDDAPSVLVSSSAVGYYGHRGGEVVTEQTPAGDDFLARVCVAWEAAAAPAAAAGIRVVHPRTGVVIADGGDLIDKIELPFKAGVGGKVGSGRQYVPWISLADHVAAMRFLLDGDLDGPVNLCAPEPVTNLELTKAIGEVLHRPTVLPIPTFAVGLLYGRMGTTLATTSQRAVPRRLLDAGFTFRHRSIVEALQVAFDRSGAASGAA